MSAVNRVTVGCVAVVTAFAGPARTTVSREPIIEQVAKLHAARAAHTAVAIRSGSVLLAGGMGAGGGILASVELFDPADNSVRELGSMVERRAGHSATPLGDGRILVAGGYNGEYLNSLEVFDPSTGRFERAGTLITGRSGHTATILEDGRVLMVGGVGRGWAFLRSAELYDPVTQRSQEVGSMSVPRESHTATLLAGGRVLVVGGHSGRRQAMKVHASAEIFDPQTLRFEAVGGLAVGRHKHDAVRLADGRVLVLGGADRTDRGHYATTEVFGPSSRAFLNGPTMAEKRYKFTGTSLRLADGDVLVASGGRIAEIFDHRTSAFRRVSGPFPDPYRYATATPVTNGDVIIAGGYADDNRTTAGVWRFRHRQ